MRAKASFKLPVQIFISYSSKDEVLKEKLVINLAALQREKLVENWHFRLISPGEDWDEVVHEELDKSQIILLLISPDFIKSDYCVETEAALAIQRHRAGHAKVIPVILRPSKWKEISFGQDNFKLGQLSVLPINGKPATKWKNRDDAFLDVTEGIRKVILENIPAPGNPVNSPIVANPKKKDPPVMPPPKGSNRKIVFVNRLNEISDITSILPAPYLLISAPQAYGKTLLLQHVISKLQGEYQCFYLELKKPESSIRNLAGQLLTSLSIPLTGFSELNTAFEFGGQTGRNILNYINATRMRKVLIAIDGIEHINKKIAEQLLNEFIVAIKAVINGAQPAISLRIILSGRYKSDWTYLSSKIPLEPLVLTPFDFDAVHQTVIDFKVRQQSMMNDKYTQEFAAHLMHFSGGHPGCMAEILAKNDFGLPMEMFLAKADDYYDTIIKPVIMSIENDIASPLRDIFQTLSPIRRFNHGVLQTLIDKYFIHWPKSLIELENQLLQTYLVNRDEGFLKDDITRRLFSIELRKNAPDRYQDICREALQYYDNNLNKPGCYRPDLTIIEILFLELQLLHYHPKPRPSAFLNLLQSLLNRLNKFDNSSPHIQSFKQHLSKDWEFRFNFKYLFPKTSFDELIRKIDSFIAE